MTVHTVALTVLTGAAVAAVYAALMYARRRRHGAESFHRLKFAATVVVGAVWGGVVATTGQPVTPETTAQALTTYVGVIVLTEELLKWARDEYRRLTA